MGRSRRGQRRLLLALQEIAAGDGALATVVSGHNSVGVMPILNYGTEAQKDRYVRDMATVPSSPRSASRTAGWLGRRINSHARGAQGRPLCPQRHQAFITSGSIADIALVFAVTDASAAAGHLRVHRRYQDAGYIVSRVEKKMGQNASDTCEIKLETAQSLRKTCSARKGALPYCTRQPRGRRIGIASQSVGMARAALEIAVRYSHEREAFGKPSSSIRPYRSASPTWRRAWRRRAS